MTGPEDAVVETELVPPVTAPFGDSVGRDRLGDPLGPFAIVASLVELAQLLGGSRSQLIQPMNIAVAGDQSVENRHRFARAVRMNQQVSQQVLPCEMIRADLPEFSLGLLRVGCRVAPKVISRRNVVAFVPPCRVPRGGLGQVFGGPG